MGQGWEWLLGRHKYGLMQRDSCSGMRGTTEQESYACDLPLLQKHVGWKNGCFLWEARCFFHQKQHLGGQKLNWVLRNGSGHVSSAFTLSPAPSTSLAVTAQSPVPGGDEPQGPPILAQLGVADLCATSNSRAGHCPSPVPKMGTPALSPLTGARPGGPAAVKPLPEIWDVKAFLFRLMHRAPQRALYPEMHCHLCPRSS